MNATISRAAIATALPTNAPLISRASKDPAFRSIERLSAACAAFDKCSKKNGGTGNVGKRQDDRFSSAMQNFLSTVPTTPSGLFSLLRYARVSLDVRGQLDGGAGAILTLLRSIEASCAALFPATLSSEVRADADPIFAAISEHRRLGKEWIRLAAELESLENKAKKKHGPRPWTLIAWRNHGSVGGHEIERVRDELLQLPGIDRKAINGEYRDAKARERSAQNKQRAWFRKTGLASRQRELDGGIEAERKAADKLALTRPQTPAGAAALLAYVTTDMDEWASDWHKEALVTLAKVCGDWDPRAPLKKSLRVKKRARRHSPARGAPALRKAA